jgi:peptide/nickel transport system substrate-binding protein
MRVSCGFLFCSALFHGCSETRRATNDTPDTTAIVRIGLPEANVSAPDIGFEVVSRLFALEGLTTKDQDGRPLPRLATRWNSSPDGLTWTFHLRENVAFHDGTRLTAAIARDSLEKTVASARRQGLTPGLNDVEQISANGDHELVINLRRRSAFLVDDLEFAITSPGADKTVVGTGAYKIVSKNPKEVVMERHDAYYQGKPRAAGITVLPYKTMRNAWASLMRQEIDVLIEVAPDAAEFVETADVAIYSYLRNYVTLIAFNSAKPKLAPPAVRRALNSTIDRQGLIRDVLKGRGLPAMGPLWPRHWAYDASLPGYQHDPSLASALLDAAGLKPVEKVGVRSRLSFVCLVPENFVLLERIALNVQKQLYDIGVDMQIEAQPVEKYAQRLARGDFEAVMVDMISGPSFARPYSFWRWGGEQTAYNVFGYRNQAADRWFDALRFASGDADYRAAASQLQRTLLDDPPALFLLWNERMRAISRRFDVPATSGRDPLLTLWQWTPRKQEPLTTP